MPAKSSAKLGEVKRYRGEECTGGGAKYSVSVVRRWLERLATHPALATAACRGTTRGSTWSDHGVRAALEVQAAGRVKRHWVTEEQEAVEYRGSGGTE